MSKSLTKKAAVAFQAGLYDEAIGLYQELAQKIGYQHFRANIVVAERRRGRTKFQKNYDQIPLRDLKLACVMDEFTNHSFQPECDLHQLHPENIESQLTKIQPDLFLVESAWRGIDEQWNRKVSSLGPELRSALQWCRTHSVPSVFWNKEDPIHFDTFLNTAQEFDIVFTTDLDCIARYKAALKHDRVYLLPFACQPKLHNPIEKYDRKDAFCFAGAYYTRYPERTRDLEDYIKELPQFRPVEIFDRNFDKDPEEYKDYKFPKEFNPFIVGTLPVSEIDKAYKGYNYCINLNSIKQSQSMFARRVFEILASNTIAVSNFSRGMHLFFGDLVLCSDSGSELVSRLHEMTDLQRRQLKLAALRKVLTEHTYQRRLDYIAQKALNRKAEPDDTKLFVLAYATSPEDADWIAAAFDRQSFASKRLLIICEKGFHVDEPFQTSNGNVERISSIEASEKALGAVVKKNEWLAVFSPNDFYGPNYLSDLALARSYSQADAISKASCLKEEYRERLDQEITLGTAILKLNVELADAPISEMSDPDIKVKVKSCLVADGFNYVKNSRSRGNPARSSVEEVGAPTNSGLSLTDLIHGAELIGPASIDSSGVPKWSGKKILDVMPPGKSGPIRFEPAGAGSMAVMSELDDSQHQYVYEAKRTRVFEYVKNGRLETYLDVSPGLDVRYVFVFEDGDGKRVGHRIHTANQNHTTSIPKTAKAIKVGLRIFGSGRAVIASLDFCHRSMEPEHLLGQSDILVLTNNYPSYDDLYKNAFVHTRVKGYRSRGKEVDVFRFQEDVALKFHEFQGVHIINGGSSALQKLLSTGRYSKVFVHFLTPDMWQVLKEFPEVGKVVWLHGAEIHAAHKRSYNYTTPEDRKRAEIAGDRRMAFWRETLSPFPSDLHLVFVSQSFANEVIEDLNIEITKSSCSVVHNPIDTELFEYVRKGPEQRKKILSIRPYASRQYANDLAVEAIRELSTKPFFSELEFRLIGDGPLFDTTLEPIERFDNVVIDKRFLTQHEIAELHKEYGVFLVPTRWDSHGVSRDEAMASGLVPVTNAVAAIPEFVDERSGLIAPPEDSQALARNIEKLYESPELFKHLSEGAAKRVRKQAAAHFIIEKEMTMMLDGGLRLLK